MLSTRVTLLTPRTPCRLTSNFNINLNSSPGQLHLVYNSISAGKPQINNICQFVFTTIKLVNNQWNIGLPINKVIYWNWKKVVGKGPGQERVKILKKCIYVRHDFHHFLHISETADRQQSHFRSWFSRFRIIEFFRIWGALTFSPERFSIF